MLESKLDAVSFLENCRDKPVSTFCRCLYRMPCRCSWLANLCILEPRIHARHGGADGEYVIEESHPGVLRACSTISLSILARKCIRTWFEDLLASPVSMLRGSQHYEGKKRRGSQFW